MATDLNRVILIGRLTRDPELRQLQSGTSVCRFSIANNRNYTSGGERREEVNFFNCVAWGRTGEIVNQYCRKGKQVAIDGRLRQNSWENQEGKKQSSIEVVVENLELLGGPGEGGGQGGGGYQNQGGYQQPAGGNFGGSGGGAGGGFGGGQGGGSYQEPEPYAPGGMDDDIPF